MLKTSTQRHGCWPPYTTAFVQCTQSARPLRCSASKASEGIFSVRWTSDPGAAFHCQHTLPGWLVVAGNTSTALGGTVRQGVAVKHAGTEFSFQLETFSLTYRGPSHDSLTQETGEKQLSFYTNISILSNIVTTGQHWLQQFKRENQA